MPELKWLDGYTGQSTKALIALEGSHRLDSLVLAFEQGIGNRASNDDGGELTDVEIAVLAVEALEREVNNGGYGQFFANDSALFTSVVIDALQHIGCPKTASVTARAIVSLGLSPTATHAEIQAIMGLDNAARARKLERCDADYLATGEAIAERLFRYIKANAHQIRLP